MASSKIYPKGKNKDEKAKVIKGLSTIGEDSEDLDFALLRKPIQTSVTGFAQARKIFDLATEELKDLLSNECDILYECKVCRNIFRSLVNFISHKRIYCKEKFSSSSHGHFGKSCSMPQELQRIKVLEEGYQEALQNKTVLADDNDDDRIPLTKDLTTIIEKISINNDTNASESQQVILRNIPNSSVAVFQNVKSGQDNQDNMQAEVNELGEILSRDKAILQEDGSFKIQSTVNIPQLPENVIQISDDDDGEQPKCKFCGQKFSTMKTLKFHMKYKHLESRLVYPCPDCLEIFSTSWSVYRHLFKVHRKTAAQIRKLRETIQAKAFKLNNPPAFYEKRKTNSKPTIVQKITEEERLEQENQAWMDNMEGDSEIPRCGGCGRTFERRAALVAHTNTCQPRSRALQRKEARKIEIQIRKDYNKPPKNIDKPNEDTETKANKEKDPEELEEAVMEVDFHSNKEKKTKEASSSPEKRESYSMDDIIPSIKLPFAQQAEKSNMAALKQKMVKDVLLENLTCKVCNIKSGSVQKLYDHMADHYKWMRYACKLCNFKHYLYEKLPQHVKEVHKLKGDSDFYFSTVKALDGGEAFELAEVSEDRQDENASPDSRRPSRCSSDSSRLSDDSSSSCARIDITNRKRKLIPIKNTTKKKKDNDDDEQSRDGLDLGDGDSNSNSRFDENSSDIDDVEEKLAKRIVEKKFAPVRRPVRNKTKRKNEDFEYDLSNLLKMEAQGYNTYSNTKTSQIKKDRKEKEKPENNIDYQGLLKECYGVLAALSRKTAQKGKAHYKAIYNTTARERTSVFVRPMLPKILSRGDKSSPKKDTAEETSISEVKPTKHSENEDKSTENKDKTTDKEVQPSVTNTQTPEKNCHKINLARSYLKSQLSNAKAEKSLTDNTEEKSDQHIKTMTVTSAPDKAKMSMASYQIPIKFRRESLEVMKNPLINKNISDLKKAGMKTKILVIKPINRNKDAQKNTNVKIQTIKLNKTLEGSNNDKVVVVQVPQVGGKGVGLASKTEAADIVLTENAEMAKPETAGIVKTQTAFCLDNPKNVEGVKDPVPKTEICKDSSKSDDPVENNGERENIVMSEHITKEIKEDNTDNTEIIILSGESIRKDTNASDTSSDTIELVEASV